MDPEMNKTIWHYAGWDQFTPYLVIMGAGILFSLIFGDRSSLKEIFKDILQKILIMLVVYGVGVAIYFMLR